MTRSAENVGTSITRANLVTIGASFALALLAACQQPGAAASSPREAEPSAAAEHGTGRPELDWGPAPAVLPPGAELVVLQGDPASNAPFSLTALDPGGFVTAAANQAHYATAVGSTVIQVHAIGPFALTYVDPADAPSTDPTRQPEGNS